MMGNVCRGEQLRVPQARDYTPDTTQTGAQLKEPCADNWHVKAAGDGQHCMLRSTRD